MGQSEMRVLVTWGSKMGGTRGIADLVADELRRAGCDVVVERASSVHDLRSFDAVIVGGALYANRWHEDARRFVHRHVEALRHRPTWFFSSGPLDDSAERSELPPPTQVAVLMERVGALGHVTFGGRLPADAKGFPAQAMAKTTSGDWRNTPHIRAWAAEVARAIPAARPGVAIDHPGRSPGRLLAHGVIGWAILALAMAGLLRIASTGVAVTLHALLTPIVFSVIAVHYFRARGAREPVPTALTWTILSAALGALLALDLASFTRIGATWLPLVLIFLTTWLVGFIKSTMPWPSPTDLKGGDHGAHTPVG